MRSERAGSAVNDRAVWIDASLRNGRQTRVNYALATPTAATAAAAAAAASVRLN